MGLDRAVLEQLDRLLRPLKMRLANAIARAVVQSVNDARKMQSLQVGILDDEDADDAEHFQGYGFKSVPLPGAEAVVLFPNGDRGHPLVVAVDDRRYRPKNWEPGEVGLYNNAAVTIRLTKDGDVIVRPPPGREVLVDDGAGAEPLVKRSEFLNHAHPTAAAGAPSAPQTIPGPGGGAPVPYTALNCGTSVLKGK